VPFKFLGKITFILNGLFEISLNILEVKGRELSPFSCAIWAYARAIFVQRSSLQYPTLLHLFYLLLLVDSELDVENLLCLENVGNNVTSEHERNCHLLFSTFLASLTTKTIIPFLTLLHNEFIWGTTGLPYQTIIFQHL
jgi:hypothetical protein